MATLLENKERIIQAFNSIKNAIINKGGAITESVEEYADEIRSLPTEPYGYSDIQYIPIGYVNSNTSIRSAPYGWILGNDYLSSRTALKDCHVAISIGSSPSSSSASSYASVSINGKSIYTASASSGSSAVGFVKYDLKEGDVISGYPGTVYLIQYAIKQSSISFKLSDKITDQTSVDSNKEYENAYTVITAGDYFVYAGFCIDQIDLTQIKVYVNEDEITPLLYKTDSSFTGVATNKKDLYYYLSSIKQGDVITIKSKVSSSQTTYDYNYYYAIGAFQIVNAAFSDGSVFRVDRILTSAQYEFDASAITPTSGYYKYELTVPTIQFSENKNVAILCIDDGSAVSSTIYYSNCIITVNKDEPDSEDNPKVYQKLNWINNKFAINFIFMELCVETGDSLDITFYLITSSSSYKSHLSLVVLSD